MRRQALSQNGFVTTGPVWKEAGLIQNRTEMVDIDHAVDELIKLSFDRMVRKVQHGYDDTTAILVYIGVHFSWDISLRYRAELVARTHKYFRDEKPTIRGVYYLYARDFSVDHVKASIL